MQKLIAVFTGGGTGGHVYPNLALIPEFEKQGFSPVYIGGEGDTTERRLAGEKSIPYYAVPTVKFSRSLTLAGLKNNLRIPALLKDGIKAAKKTLAKISPTFVFSKGGFVSLPVVIAASKMNVPVFAHESDATLGLANRIAKLYGAIILKGNPLAEFDGEFVGIPLRRELFDVDKQSATQKLGLTALNKEGKKVLLVLGGSSGAKVFNDFVERNLDAITRKFFVLHVRGRTKGTPLSHPNYLTFEYAEEIGDYYAVSDVVLSRAGATAVFEISALKKRAVFVPLPKGASRGDQVFNGELARKYGGSVVSQIEDEKTFFDNILFALDGILKKPPMRPISADTNGKILRLVCDTIRGKVNCDEKENTCKMARGDNSSPRGGGMLHGTQCDAQKRGER